MNSFLWVIASGVIGLCIGSFLNVVIHRLPKIMEREWQQQAAELRGESVVIGEPYSVARPRSRCPHCGTPIASWQNVPLLSYLILRGRCAHCQAPIGIRYPIVELLGGVSAAFAAWHFGLTWAALGAMAFGWAMIALTFIDLDTQLLPDSITLPLLWLGLLLNVGGTYVPLDVAVIGAAAGYLALWSVYWLFKLATGKEGMGYGDFKLLAAIGAFVGWQQLPLVILASSAIGAVVGIALIVFARHGRSTPIPFGPYLAGAGVVALYWGPSLTSSYLAQM
ncbi:A24 family peptidase [Niveibacterium sp. COAC-50]|uniref:prepilin peptidase n=1 Tax=Niveibacterium sp. COAC-50 TaxID=2729384 RepID=UPI001551E77A|nr:A24 family peptidase [Niveibacterium sp. COAC-50]